jgi:hypothetical protein
MMRNIILALIALPLILLIAVAFGSPKRGVEPITRAADDKRTAVPNFANMTESELREQARNDIARQSPRTANDALQGMLGSDSMREIWRRDAEREKANIARHEAQMSDDAERRQREAIAEQRRQDDQVALAVREAAENAKRERPRSWQQEADDRELDRLANRH